MFACSSKTYPTHEVTLSTVKINGTELVAYITFVGDKILMFGGTQALAGLLATTTQSATSKIGKAMLPNLLFILSPRLY
jgi:hypothetical protein